MFNPGVVQVPSPPLRLTASPVVSILPLPLTRRLSFTFQPLLPLYLCFGSPPFVSLSSTATYGDTHPRNLRPDVAWSPNAKVQPPHAAAFATSSDVTITQQAHEFLQQHGHINSGAPKDEAAEAAAEAERAAAVAAAAAAEAEATASAAEYKLACQAFEILAAVDMEV